MARHPADPKSGETAPPSPPQNTDFAKEIERRIGPLVPAGARGQVINAVVMMMSEQFSGPIAHPKHLREYEEILPGSAERIIAMAEQQQAHNAEMEHLIVSAQVSDQKRGMRYGLFALVLTLSAAVGVGFAGQLTLSISILGVGVAGVVISFIRGRDTG